MFALAQAPPDHARRLRTQRNRRTSFCGRRSRCGADLIAAVGDRCPVGATADGSRAGDGRCCIPASGPLARPAADVVLQWKAHVRTLAVPCGSAHRSKTTWRESWRRRWARSNGCSARCGTTVTRTDVRAAGGLGAGSGRRRARAAGAAVHAAAGPLQQCPAGRPAAQTRADRDRLNFPVRTGRPAGAVSGGLACLAG
jgi:hypothetical protein